MTDQALVLAVEPLKEGAPEKFAMIRRGAHLPAELWPDDRINSVLRYCGSNLKSVTDAAVFLATANQYDLNPLMGEVYAFPADGKLRVFAGRDGFLKAAGRNPNYEGVESGTVYEGDDFKLVQYWDPETKERHVGVQHTMSFERGPIIGHYAIVYAYGGKPTVVMRTHEYFRYLWTNKQRRVWQTDPEGMGQNRCIAAAHRRAIPLANLWIQGEEGDFVGTTERLAEVVGENTRQRLDTLKAELGIDQPPPPDPAPEPEVLQGTPVPDAQPADPVETGPKADTAAKRDTPAKSDEPTAQEQGELLELAMKQYKIPAVAIKVWAEESSGVPNDPARWNVDHLTLALMAMKETQGVEFLREYVRRLAEEAALDFAERLELEDLMGKPGVKPEALHEVIDRLKERSG